MSGHWAVQYVGTPWRAGAEGPDAFDCWSFVRWVNRVHFSRELPVIDVDAHDLRKVVGAFSEHPEVNRWQRADFPHEGDSALLGRSARPNHVGVYVAGGVLHCLQGPGVVWQPISALRAAGWRRIEFYRLSA